jgi:hypothetical protein
VIQMGFLSVGEPYRTASVWPRSRLRSGVERVSGGLTGPDGALSKMRGSLLDPGLVDVPSVQPVSALASRLRGRRSWGPEFGRTDGQARGRQDLDDSVVGLEQRDEA